MGTSNTGNKYLIDKIVMTYLTNNTVIYNLNVRIAGGESILRATVFYALNN